MGCQEEGMPAIRLEVGHDWSLCRHWKGILQTYDVVCYEMHIAPSEGQQTKLLSRQNSSQNYHWVSILAGHDLNLLAPFAFVALHVKYSPRTSRGTNGHQWPEMCPGNLGYELQYRMNQSADGRCYVCCGEPVYLIIHVLLYHHLLLQYSP